MEFVISGIFLAVLLTAGILYLKFCKDLAKDVMNRVNFRKTLEKEGGDNWPVLHFGMENNDDGDEFTYADIEKHDRERKNEKKKLCLKG